MTFTTSYLITVIKHPRFCRTFSFVVFDFLTQIYQPKIIVPLIQIECVIIWMLDGNRKVAELNLCLFKNAEYLSANVYFSVKDTGESGKTSNVSQNFEASAGFMALQILYDTKSI